MGTVWHWLMMERSLEGHTYPPHTCWKIKKRACVRFVWKGAYLRGYFCGAQQSIWTQLLCFIDAAVAARGGVGGGPFCHRLSLGKPNAIKASGENKQKVRYTRSPHHQISNLKWKANKTLMRDPLFLQPSNRHEVIPHPMVHCFLLLSQDLTDTFVITVLNTTIKLHRSANCFGWISQKCVAGIHPATHIRWRLLISSPPNVTGVKRHAAHTVTAVVKLSPDGYENQTSNITINTGWDVTTNLNTHISPTD